MMVTDTQIQQEVMAHIKWNPLLDASEIGVFVKDGVVTLSGQVDTYFKKVEAEREAQKVYGVKAIAEDIHVGLSPGATKTDTEIADSVVHALQLHTSIPDEKIRVKVEDGVVTLEGEVGWEFQREAVRYTVAQLAGVRRLVNHICLRKTISQVELKQKISDALCRSAMLDADKIEVQINGTQAILKGIVRSFAEKEDAEKAAWEYPGILFVKNYLELEGERSVGLYASDLSFFTGTLS